MRGDAGTTGTRLYSLALLYENIVLDRHCWTHDFRVHIQALGWITAVWQAVDPEIANNGWGGDLACGKRRRRQRGNTDSRQGISM